MKSMLELGTFDDSVFEWIAPPEEDWPDLGCSSVSRRPFSVPTRTPHEDWSQSLRKAVVLIQASRCAQHQATTSGLCAQLDEIEDKLTKAAQMIAELQTAVRNLQSTGQTQVVPITSLAPRPFVVLREIPILVESQVSDDNEEGIEYVCRFVEASVGTTGDTFEEAIRNMKDRLVSKFNVLDRIPSEKLGDGPRYQFAVLQSVIARAD